jgi:hypothetical protein
MTASQQNQVIQKAFGGGKTSGAILTLLEESDRLKDKYGELGTTRSRADKFQEAWAASRSSSLSRPTSWAPRPRSSGSPSATS